MTRPRTVSLDAQILALLATGLKPKEVAARLGLKNKWRVYHARRRAK
jgi:DNA-binding CsgD family transcriptional regulator